MSQPLSGGLGRKVPLQSERRQYMAVQNSPNRSIELRQAVVLLLLLIGVVCVPAGAAVLWGIGGALITGGALCVVLGVILGVL